MRFPALRRNRPASSTATEMVVGVAGAIRYLGTLGASGSLIADALMVFEDQIVVWRDSDSTTVISPYHQERMQALIDAMEVFNRIFGDRAEEFFLSIAYYGFGARSRTALQLVQDLHTDSLNELLGQVVRGYRGPTAGS